VNDKNFEKQILIERSFYENFDKMTYGEYYYLLGHSITNFRYLDRWENEILPYLESLQNRTGNINDWNSFEWGGTICFRYDCVMILDQSIFQVGRSFPNLTNDKEESIQNENGEWLLNTLFIEKTYDEYVKISFLPPWVRRLVLRRSLVFNQLRMLQ
jgi:hypothetical protein